MGLFDKFRQWWWQPVVDGDFAKRVGEIELARDYRKGKQRQQLKVKAGQKDDNVYLNYIGKIVSISAWMLFGKGIEFDLDGDAESEPQQFIDNTWDKNHREILLHNLAVLGSEGGTCFLKFQPKYFDGGLTRMIVLDPKLMQIDTDQEDKEIVNQYTMMFQIEDLNGKEKYRKQETVRNYTEDGSTTSWEVIDSEKSDSTGWKWVVTGTSIWDKDFPPIHHWQNLPDPTAVTGDPDITDDLINLQDATNRNASNINKIIRYHAHPKTTFTGVSPESIKKIGSGPDEAVVISEENAKVFNLEMQSELSPALEFYSILKGSMFELAEVVDITNIKDRSGQLTNFGLRVMFFDALSKLETKRRLYGEALEEINRRLFLISGREAVDCKVVWKDPLPTNETENSAAITQDLANGYISKQTAAKKRGYDWEEEEERLSGEKVNDGSVGSEILKAFNQDRL